MNNAPASAQSLTSNAFISGCVMVPGWKSLIRPEKDENQREPSRFHPTISSQLRFKVGKVGIGGCRIIRWLVTWKENEYTQQRLIRVNENTPLNLAQILLEVFPVPSFISESFPICVRLDYMLQIGQKGVAPSISSAGGFIQQRKLMAELPPSTFPLFHYG